MDMYGISDATLHENELHSQMSNLRNTTDLSNQLADLKFKADTAKQDKKDETSNSETVVSDSGTLTKVGTLAKSTAAGVEAVAASNETQRAVSGFSGVAETPGSALSRGAGAFTQGAGAEFEGADATAEGVGSAVKGFSGVEEIAAGVLGKVAGVGDATKFIAGKAAGELGAGIDIVKLGSNLLTTGNVFESDDGPGGAKVEENTLSKIGDVATIAAGAADLLAVFTGGILAPVAAAANLAAAGISGAGAIEQQKTDDKTQQGNKPVDQTIGAGPAFSAYGFVGQQSHDPIAAIRSGSNGLY